MRMSISTGWLKSCVILACLIVLPAHAELPDFTPLADSAGKAVVNISATAKKNRRGAQQQQEVPELFRRFFGDNFNFTPPLKSNSPLVPALLFQKMAMS